MDVLSRLKRAARAFIYKQPLGITKTYIKHLVASPHPVLLEIGSANGDDTLEFIQTFAGTDFRLYGFEPEPKNLTLLANKVQCERFELYNGVVSDIDGEVTFNRSRTDNPSDLSLSGSIMTPKNHLKIWDWIYFDEQIRVRSITLDSFTRQRQLGIIDFIWCDVQGAEEKVLLGGRETLNMKTRYLFTEYSEDEQYEGQPNLTRILELLPHFVVKEHYGSDVLLKNTQL